MNLKTKQSHIESCTIVVANTIEFCGNQMHAIREYEKEFEFKFSEKEVDIILRDAQGIKFE